MDDCVFCNIVNKATPTEFLLETVDLIAFRDIFPKAPVHILVIPKKHIPSINEVSSKEKEILGDMIVAARGLAGKMGIKDSGYKIVFNVGKQGGQIVRHLHLHLLGGKQLDE